MKVAVAGIEKNLKNYLAALKAIGLEPVVTLDPEEAENFAGLVLPGGGDIDPALYAAPNQGSENIDRSLDEAQLQLTDRFLRKKHPVLGICKGAQIINVYFGGGLIQDLTTADTHKYHTADSIHPCLSLEGSLMDRLYGRRHMVNSAHHQALGKIGTGLRVAAYAPDGTVEAIVHDSLPVLGVQWHPERMCFAKARPDTADGAMIFRYFKALLEAYSR